MLVVHEDETVSRARSKGTVGENFFLATLRRIFGDHVERAPLKGIQDMGDYVGCPLLFESKNTAKPLFQQWARICEKKAGVRWVLLWKGDLRVTNGNGPYAVMPLELFEQMAKAWTQRQVIAGADRALTRVDI